MSDETKQQKKGLYLLHIDGGKKASAVGERGEGAIAALLKEPNGTVISGAALSERIGPVESPTAAEYRALLRGLELARECGVDYLAIFSDSRILVNQMNRLWNVGDSLAELRDEAEEALRAFKGTQVSWIPRKWNEEADALVNKAFGPKTAQVIHSQDVPEPDRALATPGKDGVSAVADLERLTHLHAIGSLTDAEFTKAKAQVLDR
jgi:ribonuclease HI